MPLAPRSPARLNRCMRNGTLTFAGSSAWVMVCAAFAAHCGSSSGGGGGSPDGATTDATTDSGEGPDVAEETQGASDGSDASPPIDASDGGAGMDGSPGMDGTMPSGDAAAPQRGCPADAGTNDCFTVYASTGTDPYYLDLDQRLARPCRHLRRAGAGRRQRRDHRPRRHARRHDLVWFPRRLSIAPMGSRAARPSSAPSRAAAPATWPSPPTGPGACSSAIRTGRSAASIQARRHRR